MKTLDTVNPRFPGQRKSTQGESVLRPAPLDGGNRWKSEVNIPPPRPLVNHSEDALVDLSTLFGYWRAVRRRGLARGLNGKSDRCQEKPE